MKKLLFKVSLVAGLMLLVPYYLLGGGTMPGFLQDMFKSGKEGPRFYAAYQAAWPLDQAAGTRRTLYNLYHVLNHFNLFGGG